MTKAELKEELKCAMEEVIAAHELRNHHPLRLSDMYFQFPEYKPKWVKKTWKGLK